MGYRFSLETANTVANLTCGRVFACFNSIYGSKSGYWSFVEFLDDCDTFFCSTRDGKRELREAIKYCKWAIKKADFDNLKGVGSFDFNEDKNNAKTIVLNALYRLSDCFNRCKTKSLLLPSIKSANHDDFITSWTVLEKLVNLHPGDSCLILQPDEMFYEHQITIFDTFPHFDVALRQADLWPAVLFWNSDDFAFVPVRSEEELKHLYELLHYEPDTLEYIKQYAARYDDGNHYFIHLSDLHFGASGVALKERRLRTLITNQVETYSPNDKIDFIITGDAMDSPLEANRIAYCNFSDFLQSKSGSEPVSVLGNHDINRVGLALNRRNQRLANNLGNYPSIDVRDDIKVVFLLFNSNTNGRLAEGEIGQAQLAEIGNQLDTLPLQQRNYKKVAVLHHHVIPIKKPDFYSKRWYEKLLPDNFLDESLKLIDADLFLEWLEQRDVKVVLHGHKHVPFISEYNGIHVIACGSSTGHITHKDPRKTYLSYNTLKFTNDYIVCSQFAEELLGAGNVGKDSNTIVISY